MNVIFCSGGNDSVALIQHCYESGMKDAIVAYNDTGWAHPDWPYRMKKIEILVKKYGYQYQVIKSKGFEQMVRDKNSFPMAASRMSFCTQELKTKPSLEWLKKIDPNKIAVCYTGIRREESQNRANHPEFIYMSKLYDGRTRCFPLVTVLESERNKLVLRSGFEVLPHSSMECFPCINSNRKDFRMLANYPEIINKIEDLENSMGFTLKGKPRLMFRPYRHMGAHGIREVVRWGLSEHGKFVRRL